MKIQNTLVAVNKARVKDLTSLKNNQEKYLGKNLDALKKVAAEMKKVDKKYVKTKEAFGSEDSVLNAHYLRVAKAALDECVAEYNELTHNINGTMDSLKVVYEDLNRAIAAVDAEKAAKGANDFHHFNNKISNKLNKVKNSLTGYPHY